MDPNTNVFPNFSSFNTNSTSYSNITAKPTPFQYYSSSQPQFLNYSYGPGITNDNSKSLSSNAVFPISSSMIIDPNLSNRTISVDRNKENFQSFTSFPAAQNQLSHTVNFAGESQPGSDAFAHLNNFANNYYYFVNYNFPQNRTAQPNCFPANASEFAQTLFKILKCRPTTLMGVTFQNSKNIPRILEFPNCPLQKLLPLEFITILSRLPMRSPFQQREPN